MHRRKTGTLKSGRSGTRVTSRKQAIAIGLSEARKKGAKVPRKAKWPRLRSIGGGMLVVVGLLGLVVPVLPGVSLLLAGGEESAAGRTWRRGAGRRAFVLRYVDADHGDRLVLVNLGRELTVDPAPEPLWLSGLVAVLSAGLAIMVWRERPR